jgi:hypothetical protein
MKNASRVQNRIDGKRDFSICVKCPYCGRFTSISRLMAASGCHHFEDYTLFKIEKSDFSEIESPDERVVMVETTFRKDGNGNPRVKIGRTGEIIESEGVFKLIIEGKFDSFLTVGDVTEMLRDDDEEDIEHIRGD